MSGLSPPSPKGSGDDLVNHFFFGDGIRHHLLGGLAKIKLTLDKALQAGKIRVHVAADVFG